MQLMKGWKTWIAVCALIALAIVDISNGDYEAALTKLASAGGLVGIGHKIEKAQ